MGRQQPGRHGVAHRPHLGLRQASPHVGGFPGALAAGSGSCGPPTPVRARSPRSIRVRATSPGRSVSPAHRKISRSPKAGSGSPTRGSAASHQGGTLTAVTSQTLAGIDPNDSYDSLSYDVMTPAYDGLLTFARVGGTAGSAIVPDLATTIPTPTPDGTTYIFNLRRNIRYSDGSTVQPDDVLSSFERVFTTGSAVSFYLSSLVDADRCSTDGCDLRNAIGADDSDGDRDLPPQGAGPRIPQRVGAAGPGGGALLGPVACRRDDEPGAGHRPVRDRLVHEERASRARAESRISSSGRLRRNPPATSSGSSSSSTSPSSGQQPRSSTARLTSCSTHPRRQARRDRDAIQRPEPSVHEYRGELHVHEHAPLAVRSREGPTRPEPRGRSAAMARHACDPGVGRGGPVTCQALPPNIPGYAPYCPYTQDLVRARQLVERLRRRRHERHRVGRSGVRARSAVCGEGADEDPPPCDREGHRRSGQVLRLDLRPQQ